MPFNPNNFIPLMVALPLSAAFFIPIVAKIQKWLADLTALLTCLLLLAAVVCFYHPAFPAAPQIYCIGGFPPGIGINLVLDGLSKLMLLTIALVSLAITIFSFEYMNKFTAKPKYFALLLLMIAGMNGVVLTGDFFNLYIFIEITALSSYALVAFGCEKDELEASLKYVFLGSIASALILLAIVLLYGLTGSLNMAAVSKTILNCGKNQSLLLPLSLFIVGFATKAALVPFHAWLPDAHPSAPAPISAMLSGLVIKSIGAYTIIRILFNVLGFTPLLSATLMTLGSLSMVVGVFLAIGQWDFKRLLAWHSISQMGYVILGLGLGTPLGILGGLFHLMNHASFKSLLFLNSGAIEYTSGSRDLHKLGGLSKKMPLTGGTSLLASLSIAGVPPFSGFWSKLLIIFAAIFAGKYWHATFAAIVSILTLASFLKVQKYAFFGNLKEELRNIKEVPPAMQFAMLFLALLCLAGGFLYPLIITYILNPAVMAILNGLRYSLFILGS